MFTNNRTQLHVENLEDRTLLASSISLTTAGLLDIRGTAANDRVQVRESRGIVSVVDGSRVAAKYAKADVKNIIFRGYAGHDRFDNRTDINARAYGYSGNDKFWGGSGRDLLSGDSGHDFLIGRGGNDTLIGHAGNDRMFGNDGHDRFEGGLGNDTAFGGAGNDFMYGHAGNDRLYGYDGNDSIYGNAGDDILVGHAGNDKLSGADGKDRLFGYDGNDRLYGNNGDDLVYGNNGNDTVLGQAGNDIVRGHAGNDVLLAGEGNDSLFGDTGNDNMSGNQGNDTLLPGLGSDTLNGNEGRDLVHYSAAGKLTLTETDFQIDGKIVALHSEIEGASVSGSSGNDTIDANTVKKFAVTLFGGAGDDILLAGWGNDVLFGQAGNDTLHGWFGDDTVKGSIGNDDLHGWGGNDELYGGQGNDSLTGGGDNDTLFGEAGNDTLSGSVGDDHHHGGTGADRFSDGRGADTYVANERQTDGAKDIINVTADDKRDFVLASREDQINGNSPLVQYAEDLDVSVKAIQVGAFVESGAGVKGGYSAGLVIDWSGPAVQLHTFTSAYIGGGITLEVSAGAFYAYYYGNVDIVKGESYTLSGSIGSAGEGAIWAKGGSLLPIGYLKTASGGINPIGGSLDFVYASTDVYAIED